VRVGTRGVTVTHTSDLDFGVGVGGYGSIVLKVFRIPRFLNYDLPRGLRSQRDRPS
jgi:hypothetical protein